MTKHNTLAITTDFGDSFATSQLHAVIDDFGFTGKVIENHSTEPFSIISGAFEMLTLSRFTKTGTSHLGVIDPGVGSERAGVVIKTKNFWFIGPNNGLLYPAANNDGIEKVWRLNEDYFPDVTKTFHGRDVFIKSALYLAMGKNPEDFGSIPTDDKLINLEFENGQVLHVDAYGNLKVYWDIELPLDQSLKLETEKGTYKIPVVNIFNDVEIGKPLAYEGSSRTLELAINQGNFALEYGINNNDVLDVSIV